MRPPLYLDDGPVVRLVEQLDDGGDAVVSPHGILSHLGLLVARRQVAQGAHGRLRHVLLLAGAQDGVDERLHAVALGDQGFVVGVVAREIRQDAGGAGEHVEVVGAEQAHQHLQEAVHALLGTRGDGQEGGSEEEGRADCEQRARRERTREWPRTCLVAASDRFLRVHRQFCIRRGVEPERCLPRACIPPAERRQELQTVGGDGQELGVALLQQGNHLLQAVGQADRHLGSLLVQQQVVERGDGVEEHGLHGGAAGGKRVKRGSQTADG
ncbi:hypothetical protein EYF80_018602 [Liparis tanakae]|uniref:Uncharacterized protein n=1 Tax=Liparis tanakae TaxID=230148 RepID=A0A4Z2I1T6_9TELE|nr:hypothetical protein EYF80_018602 [Liparis tanakae]